MSSSRPFPGFDRLYSLDDPIANRPFRGDFSRIGDTIPILRGEVAVDPAEPLRVSWEMGSAQPGDIIWTTAANVVIASSRVIDVLTARGFTGWTTYPVIVLGKTGEEIPGFHGLAITGRCAPRDFARSEVVLREYPGGWFPRLRGCYFDEASWDGSDLFMERPDERGKITAWKFVTNDVREAFRTAKVRNIDVERLTEAEVSLDSVEILAAYRLPSDIKDRVANARRAGPIMPGA